MHFCCVCVLIVLISIALLSLMLIGWIDATKQVAVSGELVFCRLETRQSTLTASFSLHVQDNFQWRLSVHSQQLWTISCPLIEQLPSTLKSIANIQQVLTLVNLFCSNYVNACGIDLITHEIVLQTSNRISTHLLHPWGILSVPQTSSKTFHLDYFHRPWHNDLISCIPYVNGMLIWNTRNVPWCREWGMYGPQHLHQHRRGLWELATF